VKRVIVELKTPISEENIRRLKVGDIIYLTGVVATARDLAHKRIHQHLIENKELPFNLRGLALFHCGPIVKRVNNKWIVLAAGPTTSMRMEAYEHEVIKKLGVRLIIGKGGMGNKTKEAMMKYSAIYTMFTGGAAVLAARHIRRVKNVEWMDLGIPEAVWIFEVEKFGPLIVAIDSYGRNLFERVIMEARRREAQILKKLSST